MAVNNRPVLPGFFPDPSICRAGEDFYLVNSSFEYLPGVPVHHSRDLLRWEHIGNVLDRDDQLTLPSGKGGSGIYAPTIRHHGGFFWMVTTNISQFGKGHLIVHADDPAGPWSTPVHTDGAVGIDPDLAWDLDGTCYLTWKSMWPVPGIVQAAIDPVTGTLLSEPRALWAGTGLAHPEGPHLHHREGWWYLVVAEGGTERGHAVSVARSRSISGPFETHPANPVLTHRSTDHPVQNTGHADLVELPSGEWAAVHLGVRPRGFSPMFHVNGRETFLVGVDWEDGWPVFAEDRYTAPEPDTGFEDDFGPSGLHPRWISPGAHPHGFTAPAGDGGVVITQHLLGVRARDDQWQADALVEGDARLVLRLDDRHRMSVEAHGDSLVARAVIGGLDDVLASMPLPRGPVRLCVRAVAAPQGPDHTGGPDQVELGHLGPDGFHRLGDLDGRYLSTEVAGGFTGRVVGVEPLTDVAVLRHFRYSPTLS
ncbi:family 43 glycosylhydrolase [Lentzea sp. NPDC051208]|uniref:glycoside hydrolase family 43 protein n=1 Tax=Lentzea sp. NPDC051208 TaxID=3154642 RepID=UPI003427A3BF